MCSFRKRAVRGSYREGPVISNNFIFVAVKIFINVNNLRGFLMGIIQ